MKNEFEQSPEKSVAYSQESEDSRNGQTLLEPMVHIGVEFTGNLPPEVKEVLHELGISYRIIPMTDMWRDSPVL